MSSACRYAAEEVRVAAHTRLAGNRELTSHTRYQIPAHATVSAVSATDLASATQVEDETFLSLHPDEEYASHVVFRITSSRSALPGPGRGCQRFAHFQSILHTNIRA